MLKNYIKIALRNLIRQKGYSIINIFGLAVGMACCILIMLWTLNELSFDKHHLNSDRIYRLCVDANFGAQFITAISPAPAAAAITKDYPEVVDAARLSRPGRAAIKYGDQLFQEEGVAFADNSVFNVFTIPFVKGNPENALKKVYSIVITEEMAEKYFPTEEPLGKTFILNSQDEYTITGVVRSLPRNSHFTFNMLRSMETLHSKTPRDMEMWFNIQYYTYILLERNSDLIAFKQKLPEFVDRYMGPNLEAAGGTLKYFLQPLSSIHLHSHLSGEIEENGDILYIYIFTAIAAFILLIACVNFINLATARSASRAREVGMRKTFGAERTRLIGQFLGESIVYSFLALAISLILIELYLPVFNHLAQRELVVNFLNPPWMLAAFIGLALMVGIIAGIYPAVFLSSFQPMKVLRGNLALGARNSRFRSILVVVQFTISIALIIITFTIYNQLQFIKNKKLGFNSEQVLVIPRINQTVRQSLPSVKKELASVPGVINVAASSLVPGGGYRLGITFPEGFEQNQPQTVNVLEVDADFIPTMEIELVEGRNFSEDISADPANSVIINQTAARQFCWDDPIGKTITYGAKTDSGMVTLTRTVIGVVKDFHQRSMHTKIDPLVIGNIPVEFWSISLRLSPGDIPATIEALKEKWTFIDPNRPFDYYFMDEAFAKKYRAEERLGTLIMYFSVLAIFIGCLGLFGMSSYTAEQRTKEIGIRKVLGATVPNIVSLLSREFVILVVIACVTAAPIAYYSMNKWLQNFAYRTGISLWIFFLAGIAALTIALITVGLQAVKAASTNPVKSLRYE